MTATYNKAMPSITLPKRTNYKFLGYYTSTNGGGTQFYTATGASARSDPYLSGITLYANWELDAVTVTFNGQGATEAGTTSIAAIISQPMPSIILPKRKGYTFKGYFRSPNGQGDQYYTENGASARNNNNTSAFTLYANWSLDTYNIDYDLKGGKFKDDIITYKKSNKPAADGNEHKVTTYTVLDEDIVSDTPERKGYEFNGWDRSFK